MEDLEEFRREFASWLNEHRRPEPDFLLPETFIEVGADARMYFRRALWLQYAFGDVAHHRRHLSQVLL